METVLKNATQDTARKAANDAMKIGREVKSDFDRAVGKSKATAAELGENLYEAAEAAMSSGRESAEQYLKRGKRQAARATERVSAYADDNTALVAVGAFGAGLLAGYLFSRR